ncbi:MAG: acetyl-CoA carboxylase carboxyltransferase subunit alpha [Alphaproteobacteria bacterium]|nr:MAG: acetyl-CoA carboxylase carboxyltransferase subunit alpha [Alphaproteobacteria bacterium]
MVHLDFEKPIIELENKITELQHLSSTDFSITGEITRLREKVHTLLEKTYGSLTPWQTVQVARHPDRPHTQAIIDHLITDFTELHGDRNFGDDRAIIGGIGRFRGTRCVIIGHEKGNDTESRIRHNFGMPLPEGYRKTQRLMKLANRFKIPVVAFIDTAGAHPALEAEERGQHQAIAESIEVTLNLRVPVVCIITGEGMSGGAIAIGAGNAVCMLEHAIYTVISPEGCAAILWKTADKKQEAATAQKLTAQDLLGLKIIDEVIKEPLGGAHRNRQDAMAAIGDALERQLIRLMRIPDGDIRQHRWDRFLHISRKVS